MSEVEAGQIRKSSKERRTKETSIEAALAVDDGVAHRGQQVEGDGVAWILDDHPVCRRQPGRENPLDAVQSAAGDGQAGRVDAVIHTAGVSPVTATARQVYLVDLLGTAHVIDAFLAVASPGTSLICVASMAGHFAALPAHLERHLATAATGQLLDHADIDLNSPDSSSAYVIAKRGNHR